MQLSAFLLITCDDAAQSGASAGAMAPKTSHPGRRPRRFSTAQNDDEKSIAAACSGKSNKSQPVAAWNALET